MSTDDAIIHDYYLLGIEPNSELQEKILNLGNKKHDIIEKKSDVKLKEFNEEDFKKKPRYSMLLKIKFILKRSYTSKGEGEFNVIDNKIFENPIVRDKLTGLPMIRSSTWKGHLRFAAGRVNDLDGKNINEITKSEIIERLFGSETTSEDTVKGRLYFFPT